MKTYRKIDPLDQFEPYLPHPRASRVRVQSSRPRNGLAPRRNAISWVCQLTAAGIMAETLFFKFTGAPESVYIFTKMALEPWWRYGQGIWELAASVLLLVPRLAWAGGLLTLGAIGAAIISHLTVLGIEVQGDRGLLFGMAVTTFVCAMTVTVLHRRSIPFVD